MKDKNKRFAILSALICILACGLIASYFYYMAPPAGPSQQEQLQALLGSGAEGNTPSGTPTPPNGTPADDASSGKALPNKATGKPNAEIAKVEFEKKLVTSTTEGTDVSALKASAPYTLPPPRLAPDMFTFSSLPNNAPVAEFPLVLVGQKSLEWYRTRSGNEGGGAAGANGSPSLIYVHPPTPPPKPPPTPPPTPPPPEPPPPPKPPPEVSHSGL